MSAFVVLIFKEIHGLDWLAEYQTKVPPIVQAHGGEYLAMSQGFDGRHIQCVDGNESAPQAIGIMRFPSVAAVVDFFESAEYAPYRKMRVAQTNGFAFAF